MDYVTSRSLPVTKESLVFVLCLLRIGGPALLTCSVKQSSPLAPWRHTKPSTSLWLWEDDRDPYVKVGHAACATRGSLLSFVSE